MKVFVIGSLPCAERIKTIADMYLELGDDVEFVKEQPEKRLEVLVDEAFDSISKADRIVAVAKCDGSFGQGTTYEMAFAKFLGKPITKFRKL